MLLIFDFKGKKGFSIVEVMVALSIVAIVSVAVLTLLAASFRANILLRNTAIASGLAEEGIELVRAIRDSNWLEGKIIDGVDCSFGGATNQWREGLCAGTYVMDYTDNVTTSFDASQQYVSGNDILYRCNANGLYVINPGVHCPPGGYAATPFRRQIILGNSMVNEFVADVYVYWCHAGLQPCSGGSENVLRVEEKLRNWLGASS